MILVDINMSTFFFEMGIKTPASVGAAPGSSIFFFYLSLTFDEHTPEPTHTH
jgi:hypothetical protein